MIPKFKLIDRLLSYGQLSVVFVLAILPLPAADPAIRVVGNGDVGIGLETPQAALHLQRADGTAKVLVEETAGTAQRRLFELRNSGLTGFRIDNTAGPFPWDFFATVQSFEIAEVGDGDGAELKLFSNGNLEILGTLTTGGPSCGDGCDAVFSPEQQIETIEEHAAAMWNRNYLPGVGPTGPGEPMNVSEKIGGLLNELEKAHIYIDQLDQRLKDKNQQYSEMSQEKDEQIAALGQRIARLEAILLDVGGK